MTPADTTPKHQTDSLSIEIDLSHPPEKVWRPDSEVDTVVTFTLTPSESGTDLRNVQPGFEPHLKQAFGGARYGWRTMSGRLAELVSRMP